jgi:NAD(P)H-flavin reductase
MVFGCVALLFISFIFFFSLRPVIRLTGYEFFRKSHYIVALLYIGACWGHWTKLACWMIASLGLFSLDRFIRIIRTLLIHFGKKDPSKGIGFRSAVATITTFPDVDATVLALDFTFAHSAWKDGQHFFLTFPELTIWQAHPMTPASLPTVGGVQHHRYIIRARNGETGRLARLAAQKMSETGRAEITTTVILNGPYGGGVMPSSLSTSPTNILVVAGGTGISFALPIVMDAIKSAEETGIGGAVQLVWVIRKTRNMEWIAKELAALRGKLGNKRVDLEIKILVTRDTPSSFTSSLSSSSQDASTEKIEYGGEKGEEISVMAQSSSVSALISEMDGFSIEWLVDHHPHLDSSDGSGVIEQWLARGAIRGGTNHVYGSGPAKMGTDLRVAIAARNDGGKVFRGDGVSDVEFYWDYRL